jgi:hypothetical protein
MLFTDSAYNTALTSTGPGGGGASAADIIDLTSSVEHLREQGQAIAHQLQAQTRQASLTLIDPTNAQLTASLQALLASRRALYKVGVTAKPVLTLTGRVKTTIDLNRASTNESGMYYAELYHDDVVILAVCSTPSSLNKAEDVCAKEHKSKSVNVNPGVRASQPPALSVQHNSGEIFSYPTN